MIMAEVQMCHKSILYKFNPSDVLWSKAVLHIYKYDEEISVTIMKMYKFSSCKEELSDRELTVTARLLCLKCCEYIYYVYYNRTIITIPLVIYNLLLLPNSDCEVLRTKCLMLFCLSWLCAPPSD